MSIRLNGTTGYVELEAPATAGSNTLVLPTGNGTNGQYLQTNGSGGLSWAGVSGLPAQVLTRGTAVASTSGTAIDFTGIPSTVKRITITFNGVSTNGSSAGLIRVGTSADGFITTGYASGGVYVGPTFGYGNRTDGFLFNGNGTASGVIIHGHAVLVNVTGNTWVQNFTLGQSEATYCVLGGGSVTLTSALDRVRITTASSDTFDAGNINILYEG